ncbi:MAG: Asp23/Gls24 family envelope stress response protein [Christensenellales bacterium]|nr:Asp23/Gls24 family envelope stress response protein [Christensenellales bacterium]
MDCNFNTELGLVTVNEEVLVRVAGYAALDCYGIVGMASKRSTDGIVQLMGRENLGRGVKVRTSGDKVDIYLYIIVEYGISISAVAAAIIETVKYKVEHLTGIAVGRVNVCVEDIRV